MDQTGIPTGTPQEITPEEIEDDELPAQGEHSKKDELDSLVTDVIKKDPELLERIMEDSEVRKVMISRSVFQGPLPPPTIMVGYEKILPGATDRLITLVENQQAHRHQMEVDSLKLERTAVEKTFERDKVNGRHAFWLALVALVASLVLGATGHDTLAGWLGTTTIATILVVFVLNRYPDFMNRQSDKEDNKDTETKDE
ncbi:DUF2335 domain-containing protein [Serratia fonticola]|uniref:DUF2335 domain-containing protein n=1 Tax=Serratia fonticola TaxID=47917 RepID=UPI0021BA5D61|nr:DUF2335 domain-containing protein [Serratia fonticola]